MASHDFPWYLMGIPWEIFRRTVKRLLDPRIRNSLTLIMDTLKLQRFTKFELKCLMSVL
jgi:hypothetical protein